LLPQQFPIYTYYSFSKNEKQIVVSDKMTVTVSEISKKDVILIINKYADKRIPVGLPFMIIQIHKFTESPVHP